MAEIVCRHCGCNPPVTERLCVCCYRDHLAAMRAQREAEERARLDARRAGRRRAPQWRPETGDRGHGHGSGEALE